jgi:DNA-binding SARP family transcriptional activator
MQLRLVGPVELHGPHGVVDIGPAKRRTVLVALAVSLGQPVSMDTLADRVWEDDPPPAARSVVHGHLSRLRTVLARLSAIDPVAVVRLVRRSDGYLLTGDPDLVDLHVFDRLLTRAAVVGITDVERAGLLRTALGLWRGTPLAGVGGGWAARVRERLVQQRVDAWVRWAEITLSGGGADMVVTELPPLIGEYPLAEHLVAVQMRALHALGRHAQALDLYTAIGHRLADDLGVDPGPQLRRLHETILRDNAAPPANQIITPAPSRAENRGLGKRQPETTSPDTPTHPTAVRDAGTPTTTPHDVNTSVLNGDVHRGTDTAALTVPAPVTPPPSTPQQLPVPRQLPAPPWRFTGRTTELAHLNTALDEQTDVGGTVVISAIGGIGGIGKTALALHWAHQHRHRFPDGQLHVNLRGFDRSGRPTPTGEAICGFLTALGADPAMLPAELDTQAAEYRSLVAGKRLLIVLDNAHDIDQITPLLPGSPTCTVLITSRRQLTGLAALHGARLLDLDVLPEPDARELLAHHLGHDRLAAEPAAVAELLAICAGLPLAVRIVASRAQHHPTFPLTVLADELRDVSARLDGLDAGDLRANLRAVLSWSVRTLSPAAARLFGLLGITPGPDISLPAVTCLAGLPTGQVQAALQEVEHASMVQQHVPGRYRMHDLVRLYATHTAYQELTKDVRETALRRVLDFYTHTAHTADRLLFPGRQPIQLDPSAPGVHPQPLPSLPAALAWFAAEYPVLLAAQRTASSHAWHPAVWQLAWTLHTFQTCYQAWPRDSSDRLAVWRAALDATTHLSDPTTRIIAHRLLGNTYTDLGHHDEGIEHLHQALAWAEKHHDTDQQAHTHRLLATAWDRARGPPASSGTRHPHL